MPSLDLQNERFQNLGLRSQRVDKVAWHELPFRPIFHIVYFHTSSNVSFLNPDTFEDNTEQTNFHQLIIIQSKHAPHSK